LAFPVTVIWLLLAIIALNLIDGADGMATTAGGVISGGLGIIALYNGSSMSALIAFSLAASLVGFLAFNRPPASIYLGDAGSMTIGLFVGVLAVWSSVKESTILASAPVAILAIPLFDSSAAIVRRWLTGRSMYTTDRAHLHHLLLEKHGPVRMLLVVAGLCIITTSLAVMSVVWNRPWLAVLVLTRSFGHAEAKLLAGRAVHFIRSFAAHPVDSESETHHRRVALQGEERWDTVWEPLVAFAKGHGLSQVKIDLNLAWLHEGYHANWQSVRMPEKPLQLQISLPLFANRFADLSRVPIGRLEVISAANDPGVHERIASLSDLLADLAVEINRIVERLERDKRKNRRDQRDPQLEEPVRANARREDVSAIPVESTQVTGAPSTAYSST
jgi:UDP-GlcNAc:undecaprenyl-phosphate GlcNAc-1-phosphate transferase